MLGALVVGVPSGIDAQVATPPPVFPMSRDTIVGRIADLQRIHTPEGIEALEAVEVNGTRQWLSIRGLNRANPILLVAATQWGSRAIMGGQTDGAPRSYRYPVPMLFLMGRYDLHTPYVAAKAHFDRIEAPRKRFVTFERSAHLVMFEEPGRFLLTLVTEVLPLAGGAKAFEVIPEPRPRR